MRILEKRTEPGTSLFTQPILRILGAVLMRGRGQQITTVGIIYLFILYVSYIKPLSPQARHLQYKNTT
jgi:hypothetical protein